MVCRTKIRSDYQFHFFKYLNFHQFGVNLESFYFWIKSEKEKYAKFVKYSAVKQERKQSKRKDDI